MYNEKHCCLMNQNSHINWIVYSPSDRKLFLGTELICESCWVRKEMKERKCNYLNELIINCFLFY